MRHAEVKARFQRFVLVLVIIFFILGEKRIGEKKREGMDKTGGGGRGVNLKATITD